MTTLFRRLSILFASGAFGGLADSLALWGLRKVELTATVAVKLAPKMGVVWLYPRIVWGGIWAALFIIPLYRNETVKRGILMSLVPAAMQLFWVLPHDMGAGSLGLRFGTATPLVVILVNLSWGLATAFWLKGIEED